MALCSFQLQCFDQRIKSYLPNLVGAEILSQHQKFLNLQLPDGMIITLAAANTIPTPRMCQFAAFNPAKVIENSQFTPTHCSFSHGKARNFHVFTPTIVANPTAFSNAWDFLAKKPQATGDILQTALKQRINHLLTQLEIGSTDLEAQVAGLVGLGHGLTPAGDDFLAGLVLAMSLPNSCYQHQRPALISAIRASLGNTHPLSRAFLLDAVEKQVNGALQEVISYLFSPSKERELLAALEQLSTIGHSSGIDMLSGLLAAFPHDPKQREFLCPFIVK